MARYFDGVRRSLPHLCVGLPKTSPLRDLSFQINKIENDASKSDTRKDLEIVWAILAAIPMGIISDSEEKVWLFLINNNFLSSQMGDAVFKKLYTSFKDKVSHPVNFLWFSVNESVGRFTYATDKQGVADIVRENRLRLKLKGFCAWLKGCEALFVRREATQVSAGHHATRLTLDDWPLMVSALAGFDVSQLPDLQILRDGEVFNKEYVARPLSALFYNCDQGPLLLLGTDDKKLTPHGLTRMQSEDGGQQFDYSLGPQLERILLSIMPHDGVGADAQSRFCLSKPFTEFMKFLVEEHGVIVSQFGSRNLIVTRHRSNHVTLELKIDANVLSSYQGFAGFQPDFAYLMSDEKPFFTITHRVEISLLRAQPLSSHISLEDNTETQLFIKLMQKKLATEQAAAAALASPLVASPHGSPNTPSPRRRRRREEGPGDDEEGPLQKSPRRGEAHTSASSPRTPPQAPSKNVHTGVTGPMARLGVHSTGTAYPPPNQTGEIPLQENPDRLAAKKLF